MEKTTYFIDTCNIKMAEKKLETFNKKAVKLGVSPAKFEKVGLPFVQKIQISAFQFEYFEKQEITVFSETPIISGFSVIAKREQQNKEIEITSITRGLSKKALDFHFANKKQVCNHCNTNRNRKYTFLVENIKTGDVLEVGKTCLKDFTGHDISSVFAFQTFFSELKDLEENFCVKIDFAETVENILKTTLSVLDKNDFVSNRQKNETLEFTGRLIDSTADIVKKELKETKNYIVSLEHEKKAKEIKNYYSSLNPENFQDNKYMQDLILLAKMEGETTKIGHIVSMANTYNLEKQKQEKQNTSNFVGSLKERLKNIPVTVIFRKNGVNSYMQEYNLLKFQDEQGNIFSSFYTGSKDIPEKQEKILLTGTVKKHETYQDIKQTTLTRISFKSC